MHHLVNDHALINNTRIAHGVHGEGEPVVLIHGTPFSSYIWRNVVPPLVAAGYKVHVYDLLGYGLSERPWDYRIDTSVTGQVPVLEGLLQHWSVQDFHLVAHDIGGGIAMRFAATSPERLRSLTLIDTVSFNSWPSRRTQEQMQAGLESLIAAPDAEHKRHFRDWLLSAVFDKERFEKTSLDVFLDFISGPVGQASLFTHQVAHYDAKHTNDLPGLIDVLAGLPVQLLWGAQDAWQVVDWAYELKDIIPGAELHVLEDCGHVAMEDQPEKITAILMKFLERHARLQVSDRSVTAGYKENERETV
ncbi:alpha/beta hydrolase [Roseibium sp. HPY-6]|uniref:alpha/beta fold hydrolase n=1 Tax=Roseibium sp. HPY-6 TaxID=3229852 RepID=UPI00338E963F